MSKKLLIILLLLSGLAAAQHTFPALDTSNTFTSNNTFNQNLTVLGVLTIGGTSNQVVFNGNTHSITFNVINPAAARVYTIPDGGGAATFQLRTGAVTSGNIPKFDANGNVVDSGVVASSVPQAGSCTNQVVTSTNGGAAPTCSTVTHSMVDTSVAQTGVDINTSFQVTATHLAFPLPTAQGGTGNATGNATTATALAATPTKCVAGQAPTGVDASGNAVGCAALSTATGLASGVVGAPVFFNSGTTATTFGSSASPSLAAFLVPGTGGNSDLCSKWNAALLLLPQRGGTVDLSVGFADPQYCLLNPYNGVNSNLSSVSKLGGYRLYLSKQILTNSFRKRIDGLTTGSGSTQNGTVLIPCLNQSNGGTEPDTDQGVNSKCDDNAVSAARNNPLWGVDNMTFTMKHGPFPAATYSAMLCGGCLNAGVNGGSSEFGEVVSNLSIDMGGAPFTFGYATFEEQELSELNGVNIFHQGPASAMVLCDSTEVNATGSGGPGCHGFSVNRFHLVNANPTNLTAVANASGGTTVYTGTIIGGTANAYAGFLATIQGFTNAANNGQYFVTASSTTTLTLANASGVAETHAGIAGIGQYGIVALGSRIHVFVTGVSCTTYPAAYAQVTSGAIATFVQTYYGSGCTGTPVCTITEAPGEGGTGATCSATLNSPGAGQVTLAKTAAGSGYSNGDNNPGTIYVNHGTIAGINGGPILDSSIYLSGMLDARVAEIHCESSIDGITWGDGNALMVGGKIDAFDCNNIPANSASQEVHVANGTDKSLMVHAVDGLFTNLVFDETVCAGTPFTAGNGTSYTKAALGKDLEEWSPCGVVFPTSASSPGLVLNNNAGPGFYSGTGSPLNVVSAPVGSIYLRLDGGTSTTLYVKESGTGNTGWVAK